MRRNDVKFFVVFYFTACYVLDMSKVSYSYNCDLDDKDVVRLCSPTGAKIWAWMADENKACSPVAFLMKIRLLVKDVYERQAFSGDMKPVDCRKRALIRELYDIESHVAYALEKAYFKENLEDTCNSIKDIFEHFIFVCYELLNL